MLFRSSKGQYELAKGKPTMREFFEQDGPVCMDCPFAVSNGAKLTACYTHKVMQYSGFLSSLRSIARKYPDFKSIPYLDDAMADTIVGMSAGRYVRFGSYGEPTLIPVELVSRICKVASSWTGYTHQFMKQKSFAPFFMASTHSSLEDMVARVNGFRSFCATSATIDDMVHCPASKESGKATSCSRCGLCSGMDGKTNKSINIIIH